MVGGSDPCHGISRDLQLSCGGDTNVILFPLPVLHPLSGEEEGSADEYRCQGEVLKVRFCFWKLFTIHT
jgi:hypothetical protein